MGSQVTLCRSFSWKRYLPSFYATGYLTSPSEARCRSGPELIAGTYIYITLEGYGFMASVCALCVQILYILLLEKSLKHDLRISLTLCAHIRHIFSDFKNIIIKKLVLLLGSNLVRSTFLRFLIGAYYFT